MHTHIRTHTTLGKNPLHEESARCRNIYLPTYSIPTRQTSMLPAGFESAVLAKERLQTHALVRATTGIDVDHFMAVVWLGESCSSLFVWTDFVGNDVDSVVKYWNLFYMCILKWRNQIFCQLIKRRCRPAGNKNQLCGVASRTYKIVLSHYVGPQFCSSTVVPVAIILFAVLALT